MGPWLCGVVEVIVIWTVATQGYGKLLDASVHVTCAIPVHDNCNMVPGWDNAIR